jgi:apolipoprotein N-acyltransferase
MLTASGLAYGGLGVCVLASCPMLVMISDEPKSWNKPGTWFFALGYIGFGPMCLVSCWDLIDASKMMPKPIVPMAIYTPVVYLAVYAGVNVILDEETMRKLRNKPKQE